MIATWPRSHVLRRLAGRRAFSCVIERHAVELRWSNGDMAGRFPPAFLRENTAEAWDPSSKQRLDNMILRDVEVESAEEVECARYSIYRPDHEGRRGFRLKFSDGHTGHFLPPTPEHELFAKDLRADPPRLWGTPTGERGLSPADIGSRLARGGELQFAWGDFFGGTAACRSWAEAMHRYGVTLISGVPQVDTAVHQFCERLVGFVSPTVYGESFHIRSVGSPNNLAYSALGLQMHTDLPYCTVPPGIQLFHCLQQGRTGGESIVLDGFSAAGILREADPDAYKILAKTPVRHTDVTDDWFLTNEQLTFLEDEHSGRLRRVHFNERTRDSWRQWPSPGDHAGAGARPGSLRDPLLQQRELLDAMRTLEDIIEDRSQYVELRLKPGDMICTDNWRVLHSRREFTGPRHFVGGYMEWDSLYAKWRRWTNTAL